VDTIETLDFQSSSFDNALCSSVIEYVENPEQALCELFRVIRSDGLLVLSVPNRLSIIRLVQKYLRRACKVFGKDAYLYLSVSKNDYSSADILSLLNRVGFVVETVQLFDPILPALIRRIPLGSLVVITARKPCEE
jgi:2-polyprenyl-6-hydroxyphenyl methylase/3-demethylubiquinone-9 3-methyltransferase